MTTWTRCTVFVSGLKARNDGRSIWNDQFMGEAMILPDKKDSQCKIDIIGS